MPRGKVKFFNDAEGWGFIEGEEGCPDTFVHWSKILKPGFKSLYEGQIVDYETESGPKGVYAISVTPVEISPSH